MPPAGSRPISTSQNCRLVRTPSPSTCGHVIIAGSVLVAGAAGGGAGRLTAGAGRRVCASSVPAAQPIASASATPRTATLTSLFVERGVIEVGIVANRAALPLEEREE